MNATEKIIAWFKENKNTFNTCIEELDSYNSYLGDDRYYSMDEFDELHYGMKPSELLPRIYYGYDEDTSDENDHAEFNPNREFFRYNGYGNLVSADYKDYSDYIDQYTIEEMKEHRQYIDTIEENEKLAELFNELENKEEGED